MTTGESWPGAAAAVEIESSVRSLCGRLGLEPPADVLAERVHSAIGGRTFLDRTELCEALINVGRASGLEFERLQGDAAALFELPAAPFLVIGPRSVGVVPVIDRARGKVQLQSTGWTPRAAFIKRFEAGGDALIALSASPQAPLAPLALDDETQGPWERVKRLLVLESDDVATVAVYALAIGVFSLATPIAVQAVVNSVAAAQLLQPLAVLTLLLLGALATAAVLRLLQAWVLEVLERRLFVRTATDFAWRLPRLHPDSRAHYPPSALVHRFFEVVTLQKTSSSLLAEGTAVLLQAGLGLLLMSVYHPWLLAFALTLIVLVACVVFIPMRRGVRTAVEESTAKYDVADWLDQLAATHAVFQGEGPLRYASHQAEVRLRRWLSARQSHFRVHVGQLGAALALHVAASTLLLGLGGLLVMRGELTLGQLVAAELVVTSVTNALVKLGKLLDKGYDFSVSLHKLGRVVDLPLEPLTAGELLPQRAGGKKVEWTGKGGVQRLSVQPGERVALVPDSAAEVRALVRVLSGRQLPSEGFLMLDQIDVRRADAMRLRSRVALLAPHGVFNGTVLDNVQVGRPEATPVRAREALAKAGLLDAVLALPSGLDTELVEGGAPLSADACAQLLIARALAGSPRLLVIEDFFDALSPATRATCLAALTTQPDCTVLAVCSHEGSSLARHCERVVVGVQP